MSNVIIDDANLSNIANAIREKNGSTDTYKPADMPQAILDLSSGGGTEELETLIDNSGVLEDTEGSVSEKVEQLIDKAEELDVFMHITNGNGIFKSAKTFPTRAVVNLPNVTSVYQAFSYWDSTTAPIPIVEELTVNAPNINVTNVQHCMGQMFINNFGVKKVILNMPNESQYMESTFNTDRQRTILEEITLNFSTKNIISYNYTFYNCGALKKINGVLDFSSATKVNAFGMCLNLEEVTFAKETLSISISLINNSKLTATSVQSIIDGLATVETEQKLTLHTDVILKLTPEQLTTIANKKWFVG